MQVTNQPSVGTGSYPANHGVPQPPSARGTDATSALVDYVLGRPSGGATSQQYAYSTPQYAMPQQYGAPQQQAGEPSASSASSSAAGSSAASARGFVTQDDKGQWYYLQPLSAADLAQIQAKGYQGSGQVVQGSDGNVYVAIPITAEDAAQFTQAQQASQQSASASSQSASSATTSGTATTPPQSTVITGSDGKQYVLEPLTSAEVAQAQAAGTTGNLVQDPNGQVYRATPLQTQNQGASPASNNGGGSTTPPQSTVITGSDGKQYVLEPLTSAEVAQAQAAGATSNLVQDPNGKVYRATVVQGQTQGSVGGAQSAAPTQQRAAGGGNDYRFYMGVQDPGGTSPFVGPAVNLLAKGLMAIPAVQQWNSTVLRPTPSAQNSSSNISGGGMQATTLSTTPDFLSGTGTPSTSNTLKADQFAYNDKYPNMFGSGLGGTSPPSSSTGAGSGSTNPSADLATQAQAAPKPANRGNQSLSQGLGIGSSVLDSAAQFAAAGGASQGVVKGLQVAGAGLDAANSAINGRPIDAALAGAGGIAALVGGKAGAAIQTGVGVVSTAKNIVSNIRVGGPVGFASAAGSALGLAANFIKGTAGKVVSGLGQAATAAVGAFKAVASGAASVAGAIGGGIMAGVGIIFSLVGGKVGKWISNIAGIVAPILMSNPIGAIIGAVGLIASLLFKRRLKLTSDQQADLLGRGAGMASGAAGTALNAGAAAGATDPNAKKPLDRLHRTANNQLEVFINDGTGKETKTQTLSMGGYFDKKRKAGQDKLVDLLDRGLPDLIWQGDKKNANHITTFVNLGGGKFGDPLAADRAAKRMAAMEDYIRTHPRPTFEFPDDTSSAATKAMYRGNDGVNTKAQLAKAYADDLTYNGAPEFHPGFHNAGSPPKTYNGILVSKANAWLDGLAEAINNAVPGATGGGGGVIRKGNMMFDRNTGQKTENQIGDQTRISGVANPYKGTESQMVGYQNGFHGTRSGGFVPEVLRRTGTAANAKYSVEHGDSDSGGPSLMRANTYNGVDPMRDKDFQEEAIADANKRVGLVIDDAIGTMRKQLEAQANPEGRVYAEQTLDLKVKKYDPSQMKFADVNSDGYADMIMSGKYVQGGTWVFLNKGDATFETKGIDISAEIAALEAQQKAADAAAAPPAAAPTPARPNALPATQGVQQRSNDPRYGGTTNVASGAPTKPGQFDPSVRTMAAQRGVLV